MSYIAFMARRLYRRGSDKKASRAAVAIATSGVALGIAIMLVSISVALGFKSEVQRKVVGMGGHIQILNYASLYEPESQPIAISDSLRNALLAFPEIKNVQRFCLKSGMLKTDEEFQGIQFRGIDESYNLDFLREHLVEGNLDESFSSTENTGRLLVSQQLASQLRLKVGSRIFAYFFDQKLRARRFTVSAIYATHLEQYDSKLVFCDYATIRQLLSFADDQSSGAEVNLYNMEDLPLAAAHVNETLSHQQDAYGAYFAAPSVKDSFPHIFAWLDLLDLNVLVILALMIAVAGFTTISGLLIIILERTQFIGVMKAMGATNRSLRYLFIYYAIFIIGWGLVIGNALGLGICLAQHEFSLVHLDASTYYVDVVPIVVSVPWVLFINVVTFAISVLALVLPSFLVSHIQPAKSIRFE